MNTYYNQLPQFNDDIIFIVGFFDGVHKGHWTTFNDALHFKTKNPQFKINLLTFTTPPKQFLTKTPKKTMFTLQERISIFKQIGVDECFFIDPSKEFLSQKAQDFLESIIQKNKKTYYITTSEALLGCDQKGGSEFLSGLKNSYENFDFHISALKKADQSSKISSKNIIQDILSGNFLKVNQLLHFPFFLEGEVLKGNQQGRTIGFPTLNTLYPENKIAPPYGVYFSEILINNQLYKGLSFISDFKIDLTLKKPLMETWVYQFDEDIYGQNVRVFLKDFMRSPQKVKNLDEVKKLLNQDKNLFLKKL